MKLTDEGRERARAWLRAEAKLLEQIAGLDTGSQGWRCHLMIQLQAMRQMEPPEVEAVTIERIREHAEAAELLPGVYLRELSAAETDAESVEVPERSSWDAPGQHAGDEAGEAVADLERVERVCANLPKRLLEALQGVGDAGDLMTRARKALTGLAFTGLDDDGIRRALQAATPVLIERLVASGYASGEAEDLARGVVRDVRAEIRDRRSSP